MDIAKPRQMTLWTALTCGAVVIVSLVTMPLWIVPLWLALRNNPD